MNQPILSPGTCLHALLFCLALLGAPSVAQPQTACPGGVCPMPPPKRTQTPMPDVVRRAQQAVVQIDHRGYGGGSGVYLGDSQVLTCDHLFREQGKPVVGRVVVSFPNGEASMARLVARDETWDLAMLQLANAPQRVTGAVWKRQAPQLGDLLVANGYGHSGTIRSSIGPLCGYTFAKQCRSGPTDTLILTGTARGGDSGGPIFDIKGHLAGILWGTSGTEVMGTQLGRCQLFCRPWRNRPGAGQFGVEPQQKKPKLCPPPTKVDIPKSGPTDELTALRADLEVLRKQLHQLEQRPGPPGPQGRPGKDGRDATVDLIRLAEQVRQQLSSSIRVRVERIDK